MRPTCSVAVLNRHLTEARAAPAHQITLTPHDVEALVRITDAWNAARVEDNLGPPLTLEAVLRNVLEATANMVAPEKE